MRADQEDGNLDGRKTRRTRWILEHFLLLLVDLVQVVLDVGNLDWCGPFSLELRLQLLGDGRGFGRQRVGVRAQLVDVHRKVGAPTGGNDKARPGVTDDPNKWPQGRQCSAPVRFARGIAPGCSFG